MTYSCRKYTKSALYRERVVVTGLGTLPTYLRAYLLRFVTLNAACFVIGTGYLPVPNIVSGSVSNPDRIQIARLDPDPYSESGS